MNNKTIYYIYAYLRAKDSKAAMAGTPYYIGKGKGGRAFAMHGKKFPPKDRSNIIIMESNLTELGALALERRYIMWYGRKNLGTGILINLTDGGDGQAGNIVSITTRSAISLSKTGKKLTDEHKKKISLAWTEGKRAALSLVLTGIPLSDEHKKNMGLGWTEEKRSKRSLVLTGIPLSDEHKKNIGLGHIGIRPTAEHKAKISLALTGKPMSEASRANMSIAGRKRCAAGNIWSKSCSIDGIQYKSGAVAASTLGVVKSTISVRCHSTGPKWATWFYINNK